jgi:hypothetical protein
LLSGGSYRALIEAEKARAIRRIGQRGCELGGGLFAAVKKN